MANKDKAVFDKNFFALPKFRWMLVGVPPILFFGLTAYKPNLIPVSLGFVRNASLHLAENYPKAAQLVCGAILFGHSFEAAYAGYLCIDAGMTISTTIKWVSSTFVFGFPSLVLRLQPYLRNVEKSQP
ncbi:hypothetical protein RRG08_050901 [Elysia crispata]|uniref:Transmembrane protein 254 n=1 Tax=Elysia crispata TaxID=231223 RepID=A0AAE0ZSU8_9GAST|nr:hypothetical protein RRG08_050901 [Elysia crispata]